MSAAPRPTPPAPPPPLLLVLLLLLLLLPLLPPPPPPPPPAAARAGVLPAPHDAHTIEPDTFSPLQRAHDHEPVAYRSTMSPKRFRGSAFPHATQLNALATFHSVHAEQFIRATAFAPSLLEGEQRARANDANQH